MKDARNSPYFHVLSALQDLTSQVLLIARFLERDVSRDQATMIAERCSFRNMKSNPQTNYDWHKQYGILNKEAEFMRKGQVGDWSNNYTDDLATQINDVTAKHFDPIGLKFVDKL